MSNNETASLKKTKVLVGMAIFTALVVVLQLTAGMIKIGPFAPCLVLIPIVIGASVYGLKTGAWLGLVFGIVVLIGCISGTDWGGSMMWNYNPVVTAIICLGKGVAAGLAAAAVYRTLEKKNQLAATVCAAVVCPVVNTGLFTLGAVLVFRPILLEWAASVNAPNLVSYIFLTMIGLNFLIELGINVVLSPVIVRILKIKKIA